MKLIFLLFLSIHGCLSIDLIDISIDGYLNRFFPNVSYGLSDLPEYQRQCSSETAEMEGIINIENGGKQLKNKMKFTTNRRPQSTTVVDGENDRLQLAFVLAVGGHTDSHYNYGPGGSINGLMAVWDSWADHFFRHTSNTTSLILLFDQRDFLKQNFTSSKKDYLDNILINNMGAAPVDCVTKRMLGSYTIENITESLFYHNSNVHSGNYYNPNTNANANSHSGHNSNSNSNKHVNLNNNPNNNHAHRVNKHPNNHVNNNHNNNNHNNNNKPHLTRQLSNSNTNTNTMAFDGHAPLGCKNSLSLDQTYFVYYFDFTDNTASGENNSGAHNQPLIIFASVYDFPKPDWANEPKAPKEDTLFSTWRPNRLNKRYPTNYGYVKMTNWYAYHSVNLQLLDYFDYAGKLDNDVSFVSAFPEYNLPRRLARGQHWMLTSAAGWYHDDPRISQGVELCIYKYLEQESQYCSNVLQQLVSANKNVTNRYMKALDRQTILKQDVTKKPYLIELTPRGENDTTFFESNFNTTFRAHFLVYWLGLYTSPEVKHFAKYWNDFHPYGMWDFRWGDQQWWPRPIAVYGNGYLTQEICHYDEINTDNGKYVVHKEWPRWGTIPKVNYFSFNGTTKKQRQEMYTEAAKKFLY